MFGSLSSICKIEITHLAIPFFRDNVAGIVCNFASNATSDVIDKLGRKISGKGIVRTGRGFKYLNNIIKITKSL